MSKKNWRELVISYESAYKKSIQNIEDVRSGKKRFIKTGFDILDNIFFKGLETNKIMIIGALSSVGKTTYTLQLRDNILRLNDNVEWLSFNFEMIASDVIDSTITSELNITLRELYSVDEKISDNKLKSIEDHFKKNKKPITFIDVPIDYLLIAAIVYEYWKEECQPTNKTLIYDIDHALIVAGLENETETRKVENLMKALNVVKKKIANEGGNFIGIILSQLKRDMEDKSRIADKMQHYPRKSDLTYSQALEHYADIILVLHNPSKINLLSYGNKNYPVYFLKNEKLIPIVYLHLLKARRVSPDKVMILIPDLEHFKFIEMSSKDFSDALKDLQRNKNGFSVIPLK